MAGVAPENYAIRNDGVHTRKIDHS
jgi:hypothetical protein